MIYYTKITNNDNLEVSILEYSISEVAEKMNVTIPTLRYYDKMGLLQNLKKNKSGTGMQLTEIKEFMNWCQQGDSTIERRLNLFKKQKENVLSEIARLQETLNLIEYKEWYYTKALNDGTEQYVKNMPLEEMPKEVQEEFKKCHCC